jgi:hypothetical protein
MKDYYYILGVDAKCTTADVREAYRKLSKKFHPDLNQNDAYFENRFKDIQEAYETLGDPSKRKRYDASFSYAKPPSFTGQPPPKQKYYPRTTAIDVVFTIILISVTLLFGNYVWKAINGSKAAKAAVPAVVTVSPVAATASTHHKRKKHLFNAAIAIAIPKATPKSKPVAIQKPLPVITVIQKQPLINNTTKATRDMFKPHTVIVNRPSQLADNNTSNDLPYSSYLRSNITGVVNMHQSGSFNSTVVAVIPANSKVMVLARGVNYYKVRYNDGIGYVPKWTVLTK